MSCKMLLKCRIVLVIGCTVFYIVFFAVPVRAQVTSFAQRRLELFEFYTQRFSEAEKLPNAVVDLVMLEHGVAPNGAGIDKALDKMTRRIDCADFDLPAILSFLYDHKDNELLDKSLYNRMREAVLKFKYWFDESSDDAMCMWTENHQILFNGGAYLAGQLYPDEVFTNSGNTGKELMAIHRPRILRWLNFRFRTGFSEWLSNIYYNIDIPALLALIEYADDEEVVVRAEMVLDVLLLDIAVNCYRGTFASTHGRTNANKKMNPVSESTNDAQWLLFGLGKLHNSSRSGMYLALCKKYRMPQVICEIAHDTEREEVVNRQRMGLKISEGKRWGIGYDNLEDGAVWQSMEAYCHPRTAEIFVKMLDEYGWWHNPYFMYFADNRALVESWRDKGKLAEKFAFFEHDLTRNLREEVNIYTYRTPDYMLSSAQNYKPGYGGDQLQVWQATLGGKAVCFTTHPPTKSIKGNTPNYWTGEGWLPKVAQHKNVALILYDIQDKPGLYFSRTLNYTHAWFPKNEFDEIVEQKGWVFGRSGEGYMALYSQHAYTWADPNEEGVHREVIARGRENIWICELGRPETHGTFKQFVEKISNAPLECKELRVEYTSPSQGKLAFTYTDDILSLNGNPQQLSDYPRYDNPYVTEEFPADTLHLSHNGHALILDWDKAIRKVVPPVITQSQ